MATEKAAVDEQEDQDGQPDKSNVEERLSKLESLLNKTTKELEEERKASSGKDKKITELALAKKELQESTLSKDKLLEIRQRELEDAQAEWDRQRTTEKLELEKLRIESLRRDILAKLENFPPFLSDRVRGTNPEEIEADARNLMKMWVKERDKVNNVRKVTDKPKTGGGKQLSVTAEDIAAMTPQEKRKWAEESFRGRGPNPEADAIFDEMATEG